MQILYWSRTGITRRVAERYNGVPLDEYRGGEYILVLPSYGSPRTGNYVPSAIKKFLGKHGDCLAGVIGVGNTNFGPDYCLGAVRVSQAWGVPLVAKIDLVVDASSDEKIKRFLGGESW